MKAEIKAGGSFGLTRDAIKYIAILTMLFNHIATALLPPESLWFEILVDIGYFTAVTMCFFLVEGYRYTHSRKKYALRLLIFALISQVPYGALQFGMLNMLFTLFFCFLILQARHRTANGFARNLLVTLLVLATLFCDWSLLAAIYTILFDRAFGNRKKQAVSFGVAALLLGFLDGVSYALEMPPLPALGHAAASCIGIGVSGIVILCFYNGKKGSGRFSKWFFYVFYPAHLFVLWMIRLGLGL